jgi:hypothetical protein
MSTNNNLKCDICGYKFKTYSQVEEHYRGYDLEDETCYYPLPEENAHLVKNYICDDCYNKLGDILLKLFIEKGDSFSSELDDMKNEIYQKYQKEIEDLESKNEKIINITNKVKAANGILDLDGETISYLKHGFPYTLNATYYLDSAIDIEKRIKQGNKKVCEWAKDYGIEIDRTPEGFTQYEMVDKETFKSILLDSKVKNITFTQMMEIVNKI